MSFLRSAEIIYASALALVRRMLQMCFFIRHLAETGDVCTIVSTIELSDRTEADVCLRAPLSQHNLTDALHLQITI